MTNIDNLIAMLEDKAAGRKNEIGDVWGDWICDKAAAALREQRDEIAQLKAALAESCDERRTHLMHELGFPCPAEAERDAAMKDAAELRRIGALYIECYVRQVNPPGGMHDADKDRAYVSKSEDAAMSKGKP